jgi:hypothetical protein
MKAEDRTGKSSSSSFQFLLDELSELRPSIRRMFGFTYVYLEEKLLLSLRESHRQPHYNGVWLYTQTEHLESLRREFPLLPKRYFWRSARSGSGWVILPATQEEFEEYALRACELILRGDGRIGRVSRKGPAESSKRGARPRRVSSRKARARDVW